MKNLSIERMSKVEGGGYIDCVAMVAGFVGAAAASSTGVGIALGAASFLGAVRSAQSCSGSTSWWD